MVVCVSRFHLIPFQQDIHSPVLALFTSFFVSSVALYDSKFLLHLLRGCQVPRVRNLTAATLVLLQSQVHQNITNQGRLVVNPPLHSLSWINYLKRPLFASSTSLSSCHSESTSTGLQNSIDSNCSTCSLDSTVQVFSLCQPTWIFWLASKL